MELDKYNNNIKVSIIIPIYNVEKYLRKCLDSVIDQTLTDIEIICVDDASTDNSYEIVEDFARQDDRIKIAHSYDDKEKQQNYGLSATRNRGLKIAKGEYVLFLDSDDWLELDAAERLYGFAHRENLDVLCFDFIVEYETEELRKKFPFNLRRRFCTEKALSGEEVFWRQELCHGYYSMAPLLLCRRSYLLTTQQEGCFYEGTEHEDLLFGLKALISAPRAASVNWQLYHYFRRNHSITTKRFSVNKARSVFIILFEQIKYLYMQKLSQKALKSAARIFYESYNWFLKDMFYPYHDEIIKSCKFDSYDHQRAFDFFCSFNEPYFLNYAVPLHKFNNNELAILSQSEKIIIYGAGDVGRKVAEQISKLGFDEFVFAVTKKEKNYYMGVPIYDISKLRLYCKSGVVLVSVMPDKQTDMMQTAEKIGFKHIIKMIN